MGKTGRINKRYSTEFKIGVIMDMREHHLGDKETARKYDMGNPETSDSSVATIQRWERIYLEEGAEGLMRERRGKSVTSGGKRRGRPPKLDKKVEEDLIAGNQRVLTYIVDNIWEPLSIPALAERFFCSPSKLSRDFRAVTSLTVHEYITETRMAFARLWLSEGLPVSLTATRCGFSDASAFIRAFRGRYGETPGV